jgi:hypothetical protein
MANPNPPDDRTGKAPKREAPGELEEQRQRRQAGQELAEEREEREDVDVDVDVAADDAQLDEPAEERR